MSGGVLAGISALFFALRTYTLITLSVRQNYSARRCFAQNVGGAAVITAD